MKIKLAELAAVLSLSLVSIPFLFAQRGGHPDKEQFSTPVFTKAEIDYSKNDPAYFTLNPDSIKITGLEVKEEAGAPYAGTGENPDGKDGAPVVMDNIINTASKIWKIIVNNAPMVNIDAKYAAAYPQGITSAAQLAQWSRPRSYVYGFYAENFYGIKMIDVGYKVTYTCGGAYKGKGKFLTAVTVVPARADVGWGYRFSMTASVPDSTITNVGTDTNPVAAMQLKLLWKIATVLKESDDASVYYVQGDGYFEEIASPFRKMPKIEDLNSARPLLEGKKIFE